MVLHSNEWITIMMTSFLLLLWLLLVIMIISTPMQLLLFACDAICYRYRGFSASRHFPQSAIDNTASYSYTILYIPFRLIIFIVLARLYLSYAAWFNTTYCINNIWNKKNSITYLGNNWDEDDPVAHGGAGALEVLAADLVANGRCRTKGFAESLEPLAENSCLLFSCTFKFFTKTIASHQCHRQLASTQKHTNTTNKVPQFAWWEHP